MMDSNRIDREATDRRIWIKLMAELFGAGLVAAIGITLVPGVVVLELVLGLLIFGLCAGVCASLVDHANRIEI